MQIDDGDSYLIFGEELALGSGGLTASPGGGTSGPAGDLLELPFRLSASQKWSISERSGGEIEENGLILAGDLTGSTANALTVELSSGAALILDNEAEVGPVTIEGPNATSEHIANGSVLLDDGELNSSDRQAVNLSHIFFAGTGAVGALTTDAATLDVGSETAPAEGLEASSVRLDSASGVLFEVMGSGATAQTDYSQLVSDGPVALAGAIVVVVGKPTKSGSCPVLLPGTTYTFVSTTGTLSGTFANAPEGGPEIPISFAKSCSQLSQKMQISYHRSGGIATVNGTVEAAVVEKRQEEDSTKDEEEVKREEATKLAEEHAKKVGEEAAAAVTAATKKHAEEEAAAATKKRQEEETAKGGVLGVREGSPDATIASSFLQESSAGTVSVSISCPAGESSCAGTVTLRTLSAVTAGVVASASAKGSVLTLATGSFTIPGGKVKTVILHLSAKARRALAHNHVLRVRAMIVAHNPAGTTHTGQRLVTLRVFKAKHGNG
jgi:hypothetical protein